MLGQFRGAKPPGYRLPLPPMPLGDRGSATAERYLAAAPTARSCSSTLPWLACTLKKNNRRKV